MKKTLSKKLTDAGEFGPNVKGKYIHKYVLNTCPAQMLNIIS